MNEPDEIRLASRGEGRATVVCGVCGTEVPPGSYCGACGSRLPGLPGETDVRGGTAVPGPRDRGRYAADPDEHVLRPGIVSTIFPHLPHRSTLPFRLALLNGALLLILLALLSLAGPATMAAALLLPALYLLYLYEVGVYEDQPWLVISLTLVLGTLLGVSWGVFAGPLATQALVLIAFGRPDVGSFLVGGVLVPLVALALTLVGPALLLVRGRFAHALDGFTFGVASALGFGLGATLAVLPEQLAGGPIVAADPLSFTLEILRRGILGPLISASLTGLVAAAFWLHRQAAGLRPRGPLVSRWATIALAIGVQVVLGALAVAIRDQRVETLISAAVAIALIVIVRLVLHEILLSEAHQVSIGPEMACPHCQRLVPRMPFCPHCGIARRADPKLARLEVGPMA